MKIDPSGFVCFSLGLPIISLGPAEISGRVYFFYFFFVFFQVGIFRHIHRTYIKGGGKEKNQWAFQISEGIYILKNLGWGVSRKYTKKKTGPREAGGRG